MTLPLRKLGLTAHITFSVGWLGAVAGFLVLSIAGLTSRDADLVRGAYLAMDLTGRYAIIPFSLAALATGFIQALSTEWGLFRYYWVLVKFLLTIFATAALLLHQFTAVAGAAMRVSGVAPGTMPDVGRLGLQLVADAGLALLVLLVITTLSVFKPWGRTQYGRLQQRKAREGAGSVDVLPMPASTSTKGLPPGLKILLAIIGLAVLVFLALHLTGNGLGGHGH